MSEAPCLPGLFSERVRPLAQPRDYRAARPLSMAERLAGYFALRPGQWVDGKQLALVAGGYAWRTRVSDIRKPPFLMTVENRVRVVDGMKLSEYQYVPPRAT